MSNSGIHGANVNRVYSNQSYENIEIISSMNSGGSEDLISFETAVAVAPRPLPRINLPPSRNIPTNVMEDDDDDDDVFKPGTLCVGSYDFQATNKGDLSFKKGEHLTIVKVTQDRNWYKAKNKRGESGMIPANYIKQISEQQQRGRKVSSHQEVKLQAMPWFHGKIKRDHAEELLQPRENGLFLVRESSNFVGDYTLCVCYELRVEHYRILFKDNKVTIDEEEYFENLSKLVEHYEKDADGLICRLGKPLQKKGGLDYSVNTEDFQKAGWTIDRKDLKLGQSIGKGDFGDVYEGQYRGKRVAVKSLKDRQKAAQSFLAEASVMTAMNHRNLIQLLGVVIPAPQTNDPIYVVLEFMDKGALLEYLRSRGRSVVTQANLVGFARDIASGMEYLEQKKLVHRDLAARNILISEECVAKVSDFGLARDANFNLEGGKFPVKWTAPEALKKSLFSNKSDVWSYGITLWEMWSFGRVPYPKVHVKDLMTKIMNGYRMDSPDNCHPQVFQLMTDCWRIDPQHRPSFRRCSEILRELNLSSTT